MEGRGFRHLSGRSAQASTQGWIYHRQRGFHTGSRRTEDWSAQCQDPGPCGGAVRRKARTGRDKSQDSGRHGNGQRCDCACCSIAGRASAFAEEAGNQRDFAEETKKIRLLVVRMAGLASSSAPEGQPDPRCLQQTNEDANPEVEISCTVVAEGLGQSDPASTEVSVEHALLLHHLDGERAVKYCDQQSQQQTCEVHGHSESSLMVPPGRENR